MKKPTNATQPLLAAFLASVALCSASPVCGLPSPGQALTRQLVSRKTAAEAGPDATPGRCSARNRTPQPAKGSEPPGRRSSRSPRAGECAHSHHCQPPGEAEGSHGAERAGGR